MEDLLAEGDVDLVLGSLHGPSRDGGFADVAHLLQEQRPDELVREHLLEAERLVSECLSFSLLAHLDDPARCWDRFVPTGPFEPSRYEDEFRHVLRALASSDRALGGGHAAAALSAAPPLVARGWRRGHHLRERRAHPTALATGFADAAALAEAEGLRPARGAHDLWHRVGR